MRNVNDKGQLIISKVTRIETGRQNGVAFTEFKRSDGYSVCHLEGLDWLPPVINIPPTNVEIAKKMVCGM